MDIYRPIEKSIVLVRRIVCIFWYTYLFIRLFCLISLVPLAEWNIVQLHDGTQYGVQEFICSYFAFKLVSYLISFTYARMLQVCLASRIDRRILPLSFSFSPTTVIYSFTVGRFVRMEKGVSNESPLTCTHFSFDKSEWWRNRVPAKRTMTDKFL